MSDDPAYRTSTTADRTRRRQSAPVGRAPILVTGLPRSGTSWAGKMLTAGGEAVYVNEPLNPQRPPGRSPGVLNATVRHRFQYICPDDEDPWLRAFADTVALRYRYAAELRRNRRPRDLARLAKNASAFTLGRIRGRRALLDDPFALFSAGWFAERLGCRVVLMVRDPVSLVASWRRLGWRVDPGELLGQPLLVRDHPYARALRPLAGSEDHLATTCALWSVARAAAENLSGRHPGVRVVPYEDLVTDPVGHYRDLYTWCGLTWSARAERAIRRASAPDTGRPKTANRDTSDQSDTSNDPNTPGTVPGSLRQAPTAHTATKAAPARGFAWNGLSRTAYRPMDPSRALAGHRDRLTPEETARIGELTRTWRESIH
ncbi:sulfotransferase [Sphaerisporangium album]|uniref:sulfotransferase n=1 Tax=Sphaerisporangium album TaxID=509200 RepID=UPI001FEC510D|nr:sulfotransferase [Sphaerisporangium album]